MDAATAKRAALVAAIGAGTVTAVGQIAKPDKGASWPQVTVVVATFGLATITTAVAEFAPSLGAGLAMTILVTSLFALSDAPWAAVSNLTKPRPAK